MFFIILSIYLKYTKIQTDFRYRDYTSREDERFKNRIGELHNLKIYKLG